MAELLKINSDKPVRVREFGKNHQGIVWTVQPENFSSVIEMINAHGGPSMWRIDEIESEN